MKLYMLKGCPFAHRAVFALREKNLPFELVFFEAGKRPPELEAVGPRAKSPTLFDGQARVYDSAVVLEYLEEAYPERRLLPDGPTARAEVRMFQARVSDDLMPKHGAIVKEAIYSSKPNPEKVAELRQAFVRALEPWEAYFANRAFAVGDDFTLADVTLYTIFPSSKAIAGTVIPETHSHLRAWHDRIAARPSAAVPA